MKREKSIWYDSRFPEDYRAEYPECSMYEYMRQTAVNVPESKALWFEGKSVTYAEMLKNIDKTTSALLAMGIGNGDIVSVILPNMPQAVYLFYALNRLGAVANMIHPLLSRNEIRECIADTESSLVFALDTMCDKVIFDDLKNRPKTVLVDVADALPVLKRPVYSVITKRSTLSKDSSVIRWRDFLNVKEKTTVPGDDGKGDDLAALMYSGGTTGKSKAVMLSNRNFNAIAIQAFETMGIHDVAGKKVLALFPIFHPAGLGICTHSMLCHGLCVYLIPTFDFKKCFNVVFKNKIELLFGVPTFYEALLRSKDIDKVGCGFFRLLGCAGDYLPDKLRKRVNDRMMKDGNATTMTNGYGLTECGACCCVDPFFLKKSGTSGLIAPDVKYKIVEPGTYNELEPGDVGELCISGPTVMLGYFKDKEATDKALRVHPDGDLWLHTGDSFSIDEDGYLCFKQRLDRMFIVSGYNIYPPQIEAAILNVDEVCSCCVVGAEDRILGKRIVAYVTLRSTETDLIHTENRIRRSCEENIPQYAFPSRIIFMDNLPKTKMGKIDYKKLEKRSVDEKED